MSPSARNNVAQVYLGLLDGGPEGDGLRRRIDWMAGAAIGPRVLDVGCSEGILEVLLARRGIEVTGVDIDSESLTFARGLVADEPEVVRGRVDIVHGDILRTRPVAGLFDTLVMGDLLEDVDDPGALLDRGIEYLGPGGRVIVTTPFGAGPGEGPGRSFCLTDMIELLKPRLALERLSVEDAHIRFLGSLLESSEASWDRLDAEAVLSTTEAALVASQARLHELLQREEGRKEQLQRRFRQRIETGRAAAMRLQHKANADNARVKRLQLRAKLHGLRLADLRKDIDARTKELAETRRMLHATRSSTSFVVGSGLVRLVKNPLRLWKLPFWLLRFFRARVGPAKGNSVPTGTKSAAPGASGEPAPAADNPPYPDPSQFISFPILDVPETLADRPTVAAILDTFTESALRHEVDLVLMSPTGWREQMEKARPVCLFVESAWRGNNGGWRNLIVGFEGLDPNPLRELLEYCRSEGVPTVFWSKEDPPHFDNFLGAAREFDFVFTSDSDCIPKYRETLGHDRIYVLPFAAQPRVHNPSRERAWPKYPVCFAGSWVSRRYPERAEGLRVLLDGAMPHGLHIFDRNLTRADFGLDYRFPDEYRDAIRGTLTYDEMLTAYRCYDVMLNVNTITESPTMFARRVFESLACGTPVVSQDSVGMREMLGGHVRVTRSAEETSGHIEDLLGDEEARIREGHLAYRHVHENHTYRHRMNEVFRRVALPPLDAGRPPVSVLMPTMRPENVTRCLENFGKQTYENKELVLILNNADFDLDAIRRDVESIPNVKLLCVEGRTTLGDCLNRGVEAASGRYVAKMDDDDYYGERYLSDSVLAASFSDSEVVGKGLYFMYLEASDATAIRAGLPDHSFASSIAGGTLFIRTDVAREIGFGSVSLREDKYFLRDARQAGCRIYSSDRFNFVRVRGRRTASHSDPTPDSEFLTKCRDLTPGLDLGRAMI